VVRRVRRRVFSVVMIVGIAWSYSVCVKSL